MKKSIILIGIGAAGIVAYLLLKKKPVVAKGGGVKPADKVVQNPKTDAAAPIATSPILTLPPDYQPIEQHRPAPIYDEETGMFAYYPTRPPLEEFVYPKVSPSLVYGQSGITFGDMDFMTQSPTPIGNRLMINQLM